MNDTCLIDQSRGGASTGVENSRYDQNNRTDRSPISIRIIEVV